jgi:uncharacterized membrane protein YhdT
VAAKREDTKLKELEAFDRRIPKRASWFLFVWLLYAVASTVVSLVLAHSDGWSANKFFAVWIVAELCFVPVAYVVFVGSIVFRQVSRKVRRERDVND